MASFLENTTAEDIADEIVFQQVLLESLDPDAENYTEEQRRIEATVQDLQTRLEALTGSHQGEPSDPPIGDSSPASSLLDVFDHGM